MQSIIIVGLIITLAAVTGIPAPARSSPSSSPNEVSSCCAKADGGSVAPNAAGTIAHKRVTIIRITRGL
jgi:hypothetical protein